MLRASFCCFDGIGESAERRLWGLGVETWAMATRWKPPVFSDKKWADLREQINAAECAYRAQSADYFIQRFKGLHRSRIFPDFASRMGFLDIETDGLNMQSRVTTVALHHNGSTQVFVRGRNLSNFIEAVAACDVIVTYNGACFDLPRLRKHFRMDFGQAHLDLLPVLNAMGCRGGLKAAERSLGIKRQACDGVDGAQAVLLWKRYIERGDLEALQLLTDYNAEDAAILERLLHKAYQDSMSSYPCSISPPRACSCH